MKLAIVASGGGAAGIRHEAYFRFLIPFLADLGIPIWRMYGASVGALSVAAVSWGGPEALTRAWEGIDSIDDIFDGNFWIEYPFKAGLRNAEPLKKIVTDLKSVSKIPFTVNVTELKSKQTYYFSDTDPNIVEWVVASSRLPVLVEPYTPDNAKQSPGVFLEAYGDGGIRENLPLKRAIADGADKIIALHCFPMVDEEKQSIKLRNPMDALEALLNCFTVERDAEDEDTDESPVPVLHIAPLRETISVLDFDTEKTKAAQVESFEQISGLRAELEEFLK